ncbi:phage capsid protein [Collimonas antrihumi]|uniref:phage capsid protein n=1 Tax=Collimonas antrihumi TaxID=1940615 RepID=UPI001B8AF4B0|nr:phage capsid protein [Collimonas antrihumi]
MDSPFPQDPQLTAIAIAISNNELIADLVLPRTTPLGKSSFKYQEFETAQFFTVPDTKVGRRSQVNEVEFHGEMKTESTEDFGLEHPLPFADVRDAPDNTNLEVLTAQWLTGLVLLDREVRTARKVFDQDTYGDNSEVVGATDRFDNPDSDPLNHLLDVLDRTILRPNMITMGQAEWRALRTHPAIVSAVQRNSGIKGAVSKEAVAELLEIKQILVGRSLVNTAKPGTAAKLKLCWSGGISAIYQDETAAKISGVVDGANVTFGFTAQTGTRFGSSWDDRNIGLTGGRRVRIGESVKEVICAPSLGYFLKDVITPR